MANYNSTHTGAQVDAAVTKANAITSTPSQIDAAVTKANAITSTPSQIDGAVADATKVVANPTLAGTETELTAIEIAGTKYKIVSGGVSGTSVSLSMNANPRYNTNTINTTVASTPSISLIQEV